MLNLQSSCFGDAATNPSNNMAVLTADGKLAQYPKGLFGCDSSDLFPHTNRPFPSVSKRDFSPNGETNRILTTISS